MADEREGQDIDMDKTGKPGDLQSPGRELNAAQPLVREGDKNAGADRYPDAPEGRSFEPKVRNETAPDPHDKLGPAGDPAEGRR